MSEPEFDFDWAEAQFGNMTSSLLELPERIAELVDGADGPRRSYLTAALVLQVNRAVLRRRITETTPTMKPGEEIMVPLRNVMTLMQRMDAAFQGCVDPMILGLMEYPAAQRVLDMIWAGHEQ